MFEPAWMNPTETDEAAEEAAIRAEMAGDDLKSFCAETVDRLIALAKFHDFDFTRIKVGGKVREATRDDLIEALTQTISENAHEYLDWPSPDEAAKRVYEGSAS